MADMQVIVVTPESTSLDKTTSGVVVPLIDGEAGILPGHSPMIGRLGFGEMRVDNGGATERFYVDGGFVQVADNVVSILTPRAVPVSELDSEAAEALMKEANEIKADKPELVEAKQRMLDQARAQLRLAKR